MFTEEMMNMCARKSDIRKAFDYGFERAKIVGKENVFDFSIGNPSVEPPAELNSAIIDIIQKEDTTSLHSYPPAVGLPDVRQAIAESINQKYGTAYSLENIMMTAGVSSGISICLNAVMNKNQGEEIILIAPYFPEYEIYIDNACAKRLVVEADFKTFQIDFNKFEDAVNEKTKVVIINSPNNPTGVVYSEETIQTLADILKKKEEEYHHPIYIIADEPYREIVFDQKTVPYIPIYYDNTMVCYSYSKSISIPGARIGYIVYPAKASESENALEVLVASARCMGYNSCTTLMQKTVARCNFITSDMAVYKRNRDILYQELTRLGFECVKPEGTFYLFPKALEEDAHAFCMRARKYDLLLVPSDGFGCKGYFRLSYCVPTQKIERALPLLKKLAEEYH